LAGFDEGAAQVRRLLDRDRKDPNFDELEKSFADPARQGDANQASSSNTPSKVDQPAAAAADGNTPRSAGDRPAVSPFATSSSSARSPFGASSSTRKPVGELQEGSSSDAAREREENEAPWWTQITMTQILIVVSFTLIISLMISTFFFVLNVGAIRFNE
jgi:hypothetical protein